MANPSADRLSLAGRPRPDRAQCLCGMSGLRMSGNTGINDFISTSLPALLFLQSSYLRFHYCSFNVVMTVFIRSTSAVFGQIKFCCFCANSGKHAHQIGFFLNPIRTTFIYVSKILRCGKVSAFSAKFCGKKQSKLAWTFWEICVWESSDLDSY